MNVGVRDSQLLAHNLQLLGVERVGSAGAQDVMFGAAPQIAHDSAAGRPELRIAIYPIQSENDGHWANGITLALAALLEDCANCGVFRVLAPGIELPSLGETARLTGQLRTSESKCSLRLRARIPFGAEEHDWEITTADLPALLARLPPLAREIAGVLGGEVLTTIEAVLPITMEIDQATYEALSVCWDFERDLFVALAGQEWLVSEIQTQLERLLTVAHRDERLFTSWLARRCLVRSLLPGAPCTELATAYLPEMLSALSDDSHFATNALQNLALCGARDTALAYLKILSEAEPPPTVVVRALADGYARAFRLSDACAVYQDAIAAGGDPAELALDYARQLTQLSESDQVIGQLPLTATETAHFDTDDILYEACAAYEIALRARPQDFATQYEQLILLLELEPARFWEGFADLAAAPAAAEELRALIGELESYEGDLATGRKILQSACENAPERIDLRCAYAEYLLLLDERSAAFDELQEARARIPDERGDDIAEIERLLLAAEDEEFEMRLGEISASLRGGTIRENELEFLENALESAPRQLYLYSLLAAGYQRQRDYASALEVLLDAREQLGDEAALLHQLGAITWRLGEREVALRYLEDGLRAHPLYVPIFAQLARCHFSLGDEERARQYIVRAESLDAEHPSLLQLQAYIAQELRR